MSRYSIIFLATAFLSSAGIARAGEADDLQRMIDVAKQGGKFLEGLDERRVAREDLTLLNVWLENAWRLRAEDKFVDVRVVLDRCQVQADMIKQRITTAKVVAEAEQKEAELQRRRDEIAKTREALHSAALKKASLEGRAK